VLGASLSMLVARTFGLGWTVVITADLGIAAYGRYAMAYSLSSVCSGLLDGPPTMRSSRLSEHDFTGDQRIRGLFGAPLLVAGAVIAWTVSYVVGFALVFAAGEFLLGYLKTAARRHGDPRREQLIDLARQASSIVLALLVLLVGGYGLEVVTAAYALPYFLVGLPLAARAIRLAPGRFPLREWLTLSGTGVVAAGYMQLDVVLIGVLLNSSAAGVYGIASLVAWALAVPSQQLATRKIPRIREGAIAPPELARAWRVAAACAGALLLVGAVAAVAKLGPTGLGLSLLLMAPFVATRGLNWAMNVAVVFVDADFARLGASAGGLAVDVVALVALAPILGSTCGAVASSLSDLALLAAYLKIVRARPARGAIVAYTAIVVASTLIAVLAS
jgi:hypothetical protein